MHTVVLLAAALVGAAPSAGAQRQDDREVKLSHCVVSLIEHVQLPAQLAGVLVKLDVKEGDIVRQDQELGRVDDTETKVRLKAAQAKLVIAREKAENDSELQAAQRQDLQ